MEGLEQARGFDPSSEWVAALLAGAAAEEAGDVLRLASATRRTAEAALSELKGLDAAAACARVGAAGAEGRHDPRWRARVAALLTAAGRPQSAVRVLLEPGGAGLAGAGSSADRAADGALPRAGAAIVQAFSGLESSADAAALEAVAFMRGAMSLLFTRAEGGCVHSGAAGQHLLRWVASLGRPSVLARVVPTEAPAALAATLFEECDAKGKRAAVVGALSTASPAAAQW